MKKIITPDSWDEVTISQFQEISSIDLDNKSRSLEIISILINEDIEEIRKYDMQSLNRVVTALSWCDQLPNDKDFNNTINIEGTEYKMVKMSSFSVGEWIDIESYFEDSIANLHKILAIFYREDSLPYDTETAEQRAELFKEHVNVGQVYGSVVFFCHIAKNCMLTIKGYFQMEIMKMNLEKKMKTKVSAKKGWLSRLGIKSGRGIGTSMS